MEIISIVITVGATKHAISFTASCILLMDQVLKSAHHQQEHNPEAETLAYADDLGLITDSPEHLQQLLNIWNSTLTTFGLKLNIKKSEVMVMSRITRQAHMTIGATPHPACPEVDKRCDPKRQTKEC